MRISDWSSDVCSSDLLGSTYVNDFPNAGRMQRVTVQAGQEQRMQMEEVLDFTVRNAHGGMVPLSAFARSEEHTSELQSLLRTSYAVFCSQKKTQTHKQH